MSFFAELKRRNVIRVGVAYVVVAWLIMQFADVVLNNIEAPDWVFQAIMLVLAIGLPLVLIFAWAFEMTPDGVKREKDVDRTQSITQTTGRKLDRAIIGIMAVVIAFLVLDRFVLTEENASVAEGAGQESVVAEEEAAPAAETNPSVAVLPFINMSGDVNNEYFSDGLTETLLHMLAQLPDLHVAARTSSFAFKGKNPSINEVAAALGVAHILEGSVQKSGNRVRITAQLIRANDGFHVWSQNYDRTLDDIFTIQDEIANDVASALDASLFGKSKPDLHGVSTTNLQAYDSYLKGLEQQALFSYGSLAIAENHFKAALAFDPQFIDARIALIRNHLLKSGTGVITVEEIPDLVEPLIQQVNEQDPNNRLARAYELCAYIFASRYSANRDEMENAVNELQELLALMPTETYVRTSMTYPIAYFFEQPQQAIDLLEAGLLIDPLSSDLYLQQARIYRDERRLDEAREAAEKARQLSPGNPNTYGQLGYIAADSNDLPASLLWFRQAMEVDPQDHEFAANIATTFYQLNLPEEGDRWYARVKALAPGSAVARLLELDRAVARHEQEQILALAKSMIIDQVDMRHGAFDFANVEYADLMLEAGRAREGYEFLLSVRPDISNYEVMPADPQGEVMQRYSILLMTGFDTFEARLATWNAFTANWDKKGYPWRNPRFWDFTWDRIINGDIETATENFLQYQLTLPVATTLWRREDHLRPFFEEMMSDPRVVAGMVEFNKEYDRIRKDVQEMLQEPEWNQ
jgi:TolB-like protein